MTTLYTRIAELVTNDPRLGDGSPLGVLTDVSVGTINELMVFTQPAHLQKKEGRELTAEERDGIRGAFLRSRLSPPGSS